MLGLVSTRELSDEAVLEETRKFNAGLEQAIARQPSIHLVEPAVTRRARFEGRSIWPAPQILPEGRDRRIAGRGGRVGLRVFVPERVGGVFLYIHGGGWVLGAANQQDVRLWRTACEAEVAVVSVEYRLAPEDPYPAGPDDCEDAALWLVEQAKAEFGTDRLTIGGDSAGAHLAVLSLLRLRDRHGIRGAFGAANLVFGVYDLSMTPSQRRWGERNLILSTPIMEWFGDQFLPAMSHEDRRSPEVSPLYADLAGLPPALFSVGTQDPLLDDSLFMAARWQAAGNQSRLLLYEDAAHGFVAFPIQVAESCNRTQIEFLKSSR
jgi:acetyl esterase/lipase